MNDRERLIQAVVGVFTYYDKEVSEYVLGCWVEDLGQFPVSDVEAALIRHRRDPQRGQWAPKTADILRQLKGDAAEAAHLAWNRVLSEIKRVGSYGKPDISPAAREAVFSLGGWSVFCHSQEKDLHFLQRRFADAFSTFTTRAERERAQSAIERDETRVLQ